MKPIIFTAECLQANKSKNGAHLIFVQDLQALPGEQGRATAKTSANIILPDQSFSNTIESGKAYKITIEEA